MHKWDLSGYSVICALCDDRFRVIVEFSDDIIMSCYNNISTNCVNDTEHAVIGEGDDGDRSIRFSCTTNGSSDLSVIKSFRCSHNK